MTKPFTDTSVNELRQLVDSGGNGLPGRTERHRQPDLLGVCQ